VRFRVPYRHRLKPSVTPVDELVVLLDALFPKFLMDRKNQRNRLFKCKHRLISSVHYGIDNSAFVGIPKSLARVIRDRDVAESDVMLHMTTNNVQESVQKSLMPPFVALPIWQSIRSYEIKRGNGQFDAGKIRSISRDLKCIQVLLKSYGELCNFKPVSAESKIIFYYGVRSIPRPWSLIKGELDQHFDFPVVEKIEQANDYFRTKLHALLDAG
jgi:hypothetical protein